MKYTQYDNEHETSFQKVPSKMVKKKNVNKDNKCDGKKLDKTEHSKLRDMKRQEVHSNEWE